jgi:hypothetical protein
MLTPEWDERFARLTPFLRGWAEEMESLAHGLEASVTHGLRPEDAAQNERSRRVGGLCRERGKERSRRNDWHRPS